MTGEYDKGPFYEHDIIHIEHDWKRIETCTGCGKRKPGEVSERYSFGIYAGRLCVDCCFGYRDHCGLDQPQGNPYDLDEQIDDDY